MIKCNECGKEFCGTKNDPKKIFVCRFCMGEGIDPARWADKSPIERERALVKALTNAVSWWRGYMVTNNSPNEGRMITPDEQKDFDHCLEILK